MLRRWTILPRWCDTHPIASSRLDDPGSGTTGEPPHLDAKPHPHKVPVSNPCTSSSYDVCGGPMKVIAALTEYSKSDRCLKEVEGPGGEPEMLLCWFCCVDVTQRRDVTSHWWSPQVR